MNLKNKTHLRIFIVCLLFVAVCLVYFLRMINIALASDPDDKIQTGTYERREVIEAVRGEIYDRNGKKLIYNEYSYNLIFDYDAMAATQAQRNVSILQIINALEATGNTSHMKQESFPFDGVYPNYTYSEQAMNTDSDIYYRLLKRIAQNELETESDKPQNELTVSQLADFYAQNPDKFPSEQEIIDFYLKKYKIVSDDAQSSFSNEEIDKILRMRYDMEVNDFSIYNRYTVATDIDMSSIVYIKELSVAGADFSTKASRVYAYPGYASHILGQIGSIPAESWEYYSSLGYEMNDIVGISGCEQIFEQYLRGQNGVRVVVEDKNGNIIDSRIEKEAVAGNDVYLTIDIDLQIAAEEGIKTNISFLEGTEAGAITAVDPNNGEVLALASYPTYDLSTYNENYNALISNPANPLLNRALNGTYAPGSTFKVGMVAAGISNGTMTPSKTVFCSGQYTYYSDYQPKCWVYPGAHYQVNASYALQTSCNCYFYELGRLMGIEKMNEYCRAYGLGEYTGIELGEKKGILAGPDYRDENGLTGWTAGNTISAAIGQSDNTFTPLQLSCYISTVLNGGTRYSARLLYQVKEYSTGNVVFKPEAEVLSTVTLTSDALSSVKQGMRQMIANSSTASYYMRNVPVVVGGKTGTAQLGGDKKDNGLFVCAAPYNNPDIVISVVIEAAGGGSEASYAAASVLEEFYK